MTVPLILEIDASRARIGANVATSALKDVKREGAETVKVMENVRGTFDRLVTAARYLGGALAIRQIVQYSDTWKQLQGRLSLVTAGHEALNQKQRQLFDIAQRNRQSLEGVYQLYTRLGQVTIKNAAAQGKLNDVTEVFAKGLAITGETAQAAQGAIIQFSQGIASNFKSGGQELNSLIEQAPRVARALADGLNQLGLASNATTGNLKQLAQDGVLTVNNVFAALQSQLPKLQAEFEKMPRTIGQAFTQLDNAMLRYIGQNDAVIVGSNSLALVIGGLANNFDTLAAAAIAMAGAYTLSLIPATIETATVSGVLAAAMNLIPFVAVATAIFLVIKYFNELQATMTAVVGGAIKFSNTVYASVVGTFNGIVEAVKNTGKVLDAFVTDLAEFVADPFHAQGFDNFKRALEQGYGDAFHGAFSAAKKEAEDFNKALDGAVDNKIEEIAARSKKESGNISAPYVTAAGAALDMAKGINEATEKTKKLKAEADPVAKIFKETANDIRQAFTSAFEKLFSGELNSFKDFVGGIKDIFIKMLAQLATLAIARPIIVPIVGALGGALGLSSDAVGAVSGSLGGGTDLASAGGSTLSGIINGFNTPLLSLQKGAVSLANTLGLAFDTKVALLDIASKFTPAAGLAGFGGNFLANMIFGNRGVGATIGGTAGAVIGTAVGGPIGAAIGSFLGNAIGGLFGGKKPSNKQQYADVDLQSGQIVNTGGQTGKKFSQENLDAAKTFAGLAYQLSNIIGGADGLTGTIRAFVGSRDGSGIQINGGQVLNFGKDAGEFVKGLTKALIDATPAAANSLKIAFDHIDFSQAKDKIEEVIKDITFAANFDKLGQSFEKLTVTETEIAFTNLGKQLEEMRKQTERLGLSVEAFDGKAKRITENFVNEYNKTLANSLIGLTSPLSAALLSEGERFKAQLKEAQTVGGNLSIIYQIHATEVAAIQQQYSGVTQELQKQADAAQQLADSYSGVADTLDQAIFSLRVGSLTTLNPTQQLAEARARFLDTARLARGGDVQSAQELPSLANTLLQLSKSFFGSTTGFAGDFDLVQQELVAARDYAQQQTDLQTQIARNTSVQIAATQQGFSNVASIMKMAAFATANNSTNFTGGSFGANNPNETVVRNLGAINASGLFPVVDQLLYAYTSGITPGDKRRSQFFELFPDQAALFRTEAHKFGIPGFATGGTTPINMPFAVGERGTEVLASRNPAMVIPIQNNAEMLLAMRESNRHLPAIVKLLQKGLSDLIEENKKQASAIRRLSDSQRRSNTAAA